MISGFVTLVGVAATVWAGLQVGSPTELYITALVVAGGLLVTLLVSPSVVAFLGGVLVFAGGFAAFGIPFPELGAGMIIVATIASHRGEWRLPAALLVFAPMLLIWVTATAIPDLADATVSKRLLSLVLWVLVLLAVALPMAPRASVARGLLVGLVLSLPAGAILGSGYGSRWAGLVGDPNAFAMAVAICTPLVAGELNLKRWQQTVLWLLSATLVVTADSRTGMLALAVAALVFFLLPALRVWVIALPIGAIYTANNLPDDVVRGGRWEDRAGSDDLRARIDEASNRQIAESPLSGHGLGSGKVDLAEYGDPPEDLTFFLHNSYKSLVTEVGFIGLSLYIVLAVGAVLRAFRGHMARGALAAIAATAIMAAQLGEVLFTIPAALALGYAWANSPSEEHELLPPDTAPTSVPQQATEPPLKTGLA